MMTTTPQFSLAELDILREIANIGSGHAATVLSQMIAMPVMIDVPTISVEHLHAVTRRMVPEHTAAVALFMQVVGDLTGQTSFVLSEENAARLCRLLLGGEMGSDGLHGAMEESTLKEIGNVMVSGFLTALSAFLGQCLVPSVPEIVFGSAEQLAGGSAERLLTEGEPVLAATTNFRVGDGGPDAHRMRGVFLFAMDPAARTTLLSALRHPL